MRKIYFVAQVFYESFDEKKLKEKYDKSNTKLTYEEYLEDLKRKNKDQYSVGYSTSSFHLNKKEAIKYAEYNAGNINEFGSYNYCAVVSSPISVSYYNSYQDEKKDFIIFKYSPEKDKYERIDETNEEYYPILYELKGIYYRK